jgi:hypothetical protein
MPDAGGDCSMPGCDGGEDDPMHTQDETEPISNATSPRAEDKKAPPDPKKKKDDTDAKKLPPWLMKKKGQKPAKDELELGRVLVFRARLSADDKAAFDAETEIIRQNLAHPTAVVPHGFRAAKYTPPEAATRCLLCGAAEPDGGICNSPA